MIFFLFKIAADIEDDETETQDEVTDVEMTENSIDLTDPQSLTSESISNVTPFRAPADAVMSGNKKRKVKKSNTEKRMDEAYQILKIMSEKPDQDECSLYTELLCRKLRALNENIREIAMNEIDNIMYHLKQQNRPPYSVSSQSSLAHVENFQYRTLPEVYHYHDSHSHFESIPGFSPSPHSHLQPSSEFQSSSHSHSQPSSEFQSSSHSHSQPSPIFSPSPHSHSQSSPGFSPSPHSHSQSPGFSSSPHSHSQPLPGLLPSPYSNSQALPGWQPFPQSYSQPFSHSYSQPSLEDTLQENRDNDEIDICHL